MINKSTYIEQYYEAIKSGKIVAPSWVIKQYEQIIPIVEGKDAKYYYSQKRGEAPIEFAEKFCKQSKDDWVGKPINYLLWQKAALSAIFGIVERETKRRKFTDIFIEVAKKNGKTTMLAPVVLYLLGMPGMEIYSAANARDQACIIWDEAKNMLEQSPQLQTRLKKRQYELINKLPQGFSRFKALANNPTMLDGKMPMVVVLDEIHELRHDIYGILKRGQVSVKEPLFFMITTKGFLRGALYDEQIAYAKALLNGTMVNEHQFSLLYELEEEKDLYDEDAWIKANPSLDVLITRDKLRQYLREAEGKPKEYNEILTKHFNFGGASATTYFMYDKIKNADTFELKQFKRSWAIGGVDLSRTNDLTSFSTLLWDKKKRRFCVETMYWISQNYYEKVLDTQLGDSYRTWVSEGYIRIAGKNIIDHRAIIDYVNDMVKKYGIVYRWIYYDAYAASYLINDLDREGYRAGVCLVAAPQGFKTLSVPFQLLSAELNAGNICYNMNPVTEWCITNVAVETDRNGNQLPKKADDSNNMKIDGFATLLNCFVGVVAHRDEFVS